MAELTIVEQEEKICRFANIPTLLGHEFEKHPAQHPNAGWCIRCFEPRTSHTYPSVATDDAAMVMLMKHLKLKPGMHLTVGIANNGNWRAELRQLGPGYPNWVGAEHGDPTTALFLAVLRLMDMQERGWSNQGVGNAT